MIGFSPSIFELRPTIRIGEILVASIGTLLQIYMYPLQSWTWKLPNEHFDLLRNLETSDKISYLVTIVNHL